MLLVNLEGKRTLRRLYYTQKDNIKWDAKKIVWEGTDKIRVAQD
jgi:hypothetical protein